jgi:hypothetical protein
VPDREKGRRCIMARSFAEAMFAAQAQRFGMNREKAERAYVKAWEEKTSNPTPDEDEEQAD